MKLSNYFLPTLKESPREAEIVSHQLMLRAGMIRQLGQGLYSFLPYGLAVLQKVENIVRDELNKAGCQEVKLPIIQPTSLWEESGRGTYGDEALKIKDRHERDYLFSPTCEEVITDLIRNNIKSYKDLPKNLYQINWKFRDEIRPRFGLMRGREFLMKDGYSFHETKEDAEAEYYKMLKVYFRIFKRLGLTAIPFTADSGEIGGDMSHEFQVLAKTGESEIYYDSYYEDIEDIDLGILKEKYAATDEKHNPSKAPADVKKGRGIEVGHIFYLGDKYSSPLKAQYQSKEGKVETMQMSTFGIGVSRLLGAIIEAHHDDNGIIFPEAVAPFKAVLINIRVKDEACTKACDKLYEALNNAGIETLYDNTDNGAGYKFNNANLIGAPYQIAIGPRTLEANEAELVNRTTGEKELVKIDELISKLS